MINESQTNVKRMSNECQTKTKEHARFMNNIRQMKQPLAETTLNQLNLIEESSNIYQKRLSDMR